MYDYSPRGDRREIELRSMSLILLTPYNSTRNSSVTVAGSYKYHT
jgi:hypothetical protein